MLCYITMKSKQAHSASKYEFPTWWRHGGETVADSVLIFYQGNGPFSSNFRMMNQATTVKGSRKCLSLHKYTQKKKTKKTMHPMYPLIGCKLVPSLPSPSSRRGAVVEIVHPNSHVTLPSPVCSPPWIMTSSPPTPSSEGPPGPVVWWGRFEVLLLPVLLGAAAYRHWLRHWCQVTHLDSLWRPWWGIIVGRTDHFLMAAVTMRAIVVSKSRSLGNNVIW